MFEKMEGKYESQLNNINRKSGIIKAVNFDNEQEVLSNYESIFKKQEFDEFETKKTDYEIELIEKINREMNKFILRYGGTPINIKSGNVHILDKAKMPVELRDKYKKLTGFFAPLLQAVCLFSDLREDKEQFIKVLVHELMHFNSFQSVRKEKGQLSMNRVGASIYSQKNNKMFFYDLDESIIDELTRRFCLEYFNFKIKNKSDNLEMGLQKSLKDIFEANRDKFKNQEEIFIMLTKMVLTGKMKDVAILVEKTFGKGSFRRSGEISAKNINNKIENK